MRGRAWIVGCAVAAVFACSSQVEEDTDNLRDDVLGCEEALAHLQACCAGFDARAVRCNYYHRIDHGGCDSPGSEDLEQPALSLAESRCIRSRSCDGLHVGDVCARAQAAVAYVDRTTGSYGGTGGGTGTHQSHPPVCP